MTFYLHSACWPTSTYQRGKQSSSTHSTFISQTYMTSNIWWRVARIWKGVCRLVAVWNICDSVDLDWLKNMFQEVADTLEVERIGPQHQVKLLLRRIGKFERGLFQSTHFILGGLRLTPHWPGFLQDDWSLLWGWSRWLQVRLSWRDLESHCGWFQVSWSPLWSWHPGCTSVILTNCRRGGQDRGGLRLERP